MKLDNSRILVIGGAGFVGSHIVDQLTSEPVSEIIILDNFVHGTHNNIEQSKKDSRVKVVEGSITEVDLIENVSQEEALQRYADADLVIDQILIGFYGGFAVETMKMGKPVMAYIRKEDLKFMPEHMAEDCMNTIIQASPKTIFSRLCEIVENPKILKNHREAALNYVNRWHDPVYVAGITKSVYEST